MEKLRKITTALVVALSILATACDSDDDDAPSPGSIALANEITAASTGEGWTITLFSDDGNIETSDYAGYTFDFRTDGSVVATNGTNTVTGTWSVVADDDDNDIDFNINFNSPADFTELTDDWDVKSYSNTKIELEDIDEVDDDSEFLTFERS